LSCHAVVVCAYNEAYVDADCRVPIMWLERVERAFERRPSMVALTGPYRFYDWDWTRTSSR
jgi:hypothetical protein